MSRRDRQTDTLRLCGAMQKLACPVCITERVCVCVVVSGGYVCPWECVCGTGLIMYAEPHLPPRVLALSLL